MCERRKCPDTEAARAVRPPGPSFIQGSTPVQKSIVNKHSLGRGRAGCGRRREREKVGGGGTPLPGLKQSKSFLARGLEKSISKPNQTLEAVISEPGVKEEDRTSTLVFWAA